MSSDYWAHCRGVNGTKAVYKYFGSASEARIGGRIRWEREHPNEQLARFSVDCVEDSYGRTEEREYV